MAESGFGECQENLVCKFIGGEWSRAIPFVMGATAGVQDIWAALLFERNVTWGCFVGFKSKQFKLGVKLRQRCVLFSWTWQDTVKVREVSSKWRLEVKYLLFAWYESQHFHIWGLGSLPVKSGILPSNEGRPLSSTCGERSTLGSYSQVTGENSLCEIVKWIRSAAVWS